MTNRIHKKKPYSILVYEIANTFGGFRLLAEALNISTKALYQWESNGIPEGRAFQIEILSKHAIKGNYILKKQNQLTGK